MLLRRHRLAAGLSQEALAERARMSVQGIGALERGDRRTPQRETLSLLVNALALGPRERLEFEAAVAHVQQPRRSRVALVEEPWAEPHADRLPHPLTSFVGRGTEVRAIVELLGAHRLVTIAGAGGIGKTRLALEVARVLDPQLGRVRLVELAPLGDSSHVAEAVATALGIAASAQRPWLELVAERIGDAKLVLILDNCEHVVAAVASFAEELLATCAGVRILATTREPLHLTSEHTYRLSPLGAPDAIALFEQRAHAANHHFALSAENADSVASICASVDGLPLAIELAAARVATMPVADIAKNLGARLALLSRGSRTAPLRQQAMEAAIAWSYDLLAQPERRLFEHLAVFAGGWTLEAATAVCGEGTSDQAVIDLLASLVDKSLIVLDLGSTPARYGMLESFRHFAWERLGRSGDAPHVARAHAQTFAKFAERLDYDFDRSSERIVRAAAIVELENLRAALEWSLRSRNDPPLGQRLAKNMRPVWELVSPAEHLGWARLAIELLDADTPHDVAARVRFWHANIDSRARGNYHEAAAAALDSAKELEETGDGIGAAQARFTAGQFFYLSDRHVEAQPLFEEVLLAARELGAHRLAAKALLSFARVRMRCDDRAAAFAAQTEALEIFESFGSEHGAALVMDELATAAYIEGDVETALSRRSKALDYWRSQQDYVPLCVSLSNIASYSIELGNFDAALEHATEVLHLCRKYRFINSLLHALRHLSATLALDPRSSQERRERAARIIGYVRARHVASGIAWDRTDQRQVDRTVASLGETLTPERRDALMAFGAAWIEEEAVDEAFQAGESVA